MLTSTIMTRNRRQRRRLRQKVSRSSSSPAGALRLVSPLTFGRCKDDIRLDVESGVFGEAKMLQQLDVCRRRLVAEGDERHDLRASHVYKPIEMRNSHWRASNRGTTRASEAENCERSPIDTRAPTHKPNVGLDLLVERVHKCRQHEADGVDAIFCRQREIGARDLGEFDVRLAAGWIADSWRVDDLQKSSN